MIAAPPRPRSPAIASRIDWRRLAPVLLAAGGAIAWLAAGPPSVDLAAHVYRAKTPFSPWDGNWYGGHHTLGYSVLFPPLGWLLGVKLAGALSAVAAAALFEPLARVHFRDRALPGALWFAVATVATLLNGRLTFMLGVAIGLGSLLAFARRHTASAALLAVACALASPVAALFLALAALTLAIAGTRRWLAIGVATMVPVLVLVAAFPEGGYEPFALRAFFPLPLLALGAALLLPRSERVLRIGALLYALAGAATYAVHTPVGGNVVRLGALFGGPLLVCALPRRRLLASAGLLLCFAYWQISPAIGDVEKVAGDQAASPAYYRPLIALLERAGGPPARVEIPFTSSHWEAAEVAPRFPLARGWERQLDVGRNPLFYGAAPLTAATYAAWLSDHAVRFVALPDAKLDYAARSEAALIRRGLPYLALRSTIRHWRLYEFTGPHAYVVPLGAARVRAVKVEPSSMQLSVTHPGTAIVRVAWSPYWRLDRGCVARAGQWTQVETSRTGTFRLEFAFSPLRVVERGARCG